MNDQGVGNEGIRLLDEFNCAAIVYSSFQNSGAGAEGVGVGVNLGVRILDEVEPAPGNPSNEFKVYVNTLIVDGENMCELGFSHAICELNVCLTREEGEHLHRVLELKSEDRGLRIGRSADTPVHWAVDDVGHVFLAVGQAADIWDIGATLSRHKFAEALAKVDEWANGQGV